MKKLFAHYWVLILLMGITSSPLYCVRCCMRSSRVADLYSTEPAHTHHSCFSWLCGSKQTHEREHDHCEASLCKKLIDAMKAGDITTIEAHLTPENVNLTCAIARSTDSSDQAAVNLLEFVLITRQYMLSELKLQITELLISNGFDGSLLGPILHTNDTSLIEQFIQTPHADIPSECNSQTPWQLYQYQQEGRCQRKTAYHAACAYANKNTISQELRTKFAIIANALAYPSLKEVIDCQNIDLITALAKEYPQIFQEQVTHKHRSMSIIDYAEPLFDDQQITSATYTTLWDIFRDHYPEALTLPEFVKEAAPTRKVCRYSRSTGSVLHITPPSDNPLPLASTTKYPRLLTVKVIPS